MKEIKIVIDDATLYEYDRYYFKKHPKAKKSPIDSPIHPSINKWMIMRRPQMNATKQKWKDFIVWLVNKNGLDNLMIEKCIIHINIYLKTRRMFDIDNQSPKFILDGFCEAGLLKDDNITCVTKLEMEGGWDKEHPRTEITIKVI